MWVLQNQNMIVEKFSEKIIVNYLDILEEKFRKNGMVFSHDRTQHT